MPATYEPIATTTLSTTQSNITFSSIPQTYTDLVIVCSLIASGNDAMTIFLNGDSTMSNYSAITSGGGGDGSAGFSFYQDIPNINAVFNTYNNICIINLSRYTNTTNYKTVLTYGGVPRDSVRMSACSWRNTAAITSISLQSYSYNLTSTSTATLYGIKAA
jgi:hypothetical protein